MRILKLEFENINSLKGSHTIDFTDKPLVEAEIFAILGPTGSGKSTILDVITLALFNRTPRLQKFSKKTMEEQGSIITRNQNNAFAQIAYEANGKEYISKWSIAKNRNGNWNDYHMEIWSEDRALDLKKSEVPDENSRIIGLDYEQFTKAIILSQGEFSKFLKADLNERSALLEKITGTTIYRELGIKAFEKEKEKRQEVESKQELLGAIQTLSEEEIEEIKKQQTDTNNQLHKDKVELARTDGLLKQKKEADANVKALEEWNAKKTDNDNTMHSFQLQLSKLELHRKVFPFKKDLTDFAKIRAEINHNTQAIAENEQKYAREIKYKHSAIAELADITGEEINDENFVVINNAFENKVKELEAALRNKEEQGKQVSQDILELLKGNELKGYNFVIKTLEVETIDELLSQTNAKLGKYKTVDIDTIRNKRTTIQHTINDYAAMIQHESFEQRLLAENEKNQKQLRDIAQILNETPTLLKQKNTEREKLEAELKNLELQFRIAQLEEERKLLEDGKECPLCGSTHHPYASAALSNEASIQSDIAAKKVEIKSTQGEISHIEKQLSSLQTQQKSIKDQISRSLETIASSKLNLTSQLHDIALLDKKIDVTIEKKNVELELKNIDYIIECKRKIEPLNRLHTKVEQRQRIGTEFTKIRKEKKSLYPADDIGTKMNTLQDTFNTSNSDAKIYQNNIVQQKNLKDKNTTELTTLQANLDDILSKTGIANYELLNTAILQDETVKTIEKTHEALKQGQTEITARIQALTEQQAKLQTDAIQQIDIKTLEDAIQTLKHTISAREQTLGQYKEKIDKDTTEKARKAKQVQELERLQKEHQRWHRLSKLIGDARGKNFASFAQGLTLQQLIAFTNERLESLSGRYLLFADSRSQDLMIIDKKQGNTERSVKTLSGGETFLVSLALALSLSDMASRNVKLDSLFIDEGFGTLDEDTLENALGLLEKLQSENDKKVGIISHVKQLKERIAVQIQLHKNSQGHSSIKITEN